MKSMPLVNASGRAFAGWNGRLKKEFSAPGMSVFSTHVSARSHDNLRVERYPRVLITVAVLDLDLVKFRPFAFTAEQRADESSIKFEDRGSLLAWSDGFNDLEYNRGFWAWFDGQPYGYEPTRFTIYPGPFAVEMSSIKREAVSGLQSALVKRKGYHPTIEVIQVVDGKPVQEKDKAEIEYAFGAPRVIRPGGDPVTDLLSVDPGTRRPLLSELHDIRQVVRVLHRGDISSFPPSAILSEAVLGLQQDGKCRRIDPGEDVRNALSRALRGGAVSIPIDPSKADAVREALSGEGPLSGYDYLGNIPSLAPGRFTISGNSLQIGLMRSRFNHSMIGTVKGRPWLLFLYKEIDEGFSVPGTSERFPRRNGFTYEDSAELALRISRRLNCDIDQALEISEGGDPRLVIPGFVDKDKFCSYKRGPKTWTSLFGIYTKGR